MRTLHGNTNDSDSDSEQGDLRASVSSPGASNTQQAGVVALSSLPPTPSTVAAVSLSPSNLSEWVHIGSTGRNSGEVESNNAFSNEPSAPVPAQRSFSNEPFHNPSDNFATPHQVLLFSLLLL